MIFGVVITKPLFVREKSVKLSGQLGTGRLRLLKTIYRIHASELKGNYRNAYCLLLAIF